MILVTGATGHIGNVLIRELIEANEKVRAMILPRDDLTPIKDLDIELSIGDIMEKETIIRAMHGVETVYHLAGLISIMPGDADKLYRVNVEGTRNMLSAALECGVKRFVYASSIHALARLPHGHVVSETAEFNPKRAMGDYDRTKAQASLEVLSAAKDGLDSVIVCPTGVIGPYDYKLSELGSLISSALRNRTLFSVDGGYDFVDVRDVARGAILAQKFGRKGEAYILSGEWLKITDMLSRVVQLAGRKASLVQIPVWLAMAAANVTPLFYKIARQKPKFTPYSIETVQSNSNISHDKATRELGYLPRSMTVTLQDTIAWLIENRKLLPA